MLLFNIPEIAEQWFAMYGEQMIADHRDKAAVFTHFEEPGALTASFGWYRANAHPGTVISPPTDLPPVTMPTMGIWSSGDVALLESQMTGSAKYVDGSWRYERIDGASHWMQLDAPDELNTLLLDFLGDH
jgi:pimeloyl-ACP methyl ester carboxylesterase